MAMMFRLIANIGHNGIGFRFANGKTGIGLRLKRRRQDFRREALIDFSLG
jgi:hypothetical protein